MNIHILAVAEKSRILLMPIRADKPIFEGYLRLKNTPKGPRPFKFLIRKDKDTEKYIPPDDSIRLLRKAKGIFLAEGDKTMEALFCELLSAYQLAYRRITVCSHCLAKRELTVVGENAVRYKAGRICEACARAELSREADFLGLGRLSKAHLARMLSKRRDLDEILGLLSLQRIEPELTRFDVIPASKGGETMALDGLDIPEQFMNLLSQRLQMLLPVQAKSVGAGLLSGKSQLVVSATATGKSLIGELAGIKNLLYGKGMFLFLVPLVALANQKFDQLSKYSVLGLHASIKVGVSRIKLGNLRRLPSDPNSDILVGTYEGVDQMLRSGRRLPLIGTVVIDEVHMLEDKERGHRLAGLIGRLKFSAPNAQFIFLSATVGNPPALAEALGVSLVEYAVRPVPIERHLLFTIAAEKTAIIRRLVRQAEETTSSTGYRGQTIVFTNSRRNCFSYAKAIPRAAAYHAGLQYHERKRIEELFGQGEVRTVVTTAALAAGVDFPASLVIFESLAMGIEWLTVHEFNQMLGRAGRPGYQDKGLVYILAEPGRRYGKGTEAEDEVALRLLHGMMEEVSPEYEEEQQQEQVLANAVLARSRDELERLHRLTIGLEDLDSAISALNDSGLMKGIEPTRIGRVAAAHFLSPSMAASILESISIGRSALEAAIEIERFDALFLKGSDRISLALRMPISERALHGSYLDVISTGEFKNLEPKLQRQALAFARDFMRCTCKESPFCGCIERKISKTILEMRMEGLQPAQIISSFSEDYGIYAYQGDLINFLDQAVRILEAVEAMAKQQKKLDMASEAARSRIAIEGE